MPYLNKNKTNQHKIHLLGTEVVMIVNKSNENKYIIVRYRRSYNSEFKAPLACYHAVIKTH